MYVQYARTGLPQISELSGITVTSGDVLHVTTSVHKEIQMGRESI